MANLVAGSIAYTMKNQRRLGNSKVQNKVQLVFGDGALVYVAGGIPLTPASMGCPNVIESCAVVSKGINGYMMQYNPASGKLVLLRNAASPASVPLVEATGDTPAAVTVEVEVIGW